MAGMGAGGAGWIPAREVARGREARCRHTEHRRNPGCAEHAPVHPMGKVMIRVMPKSTARASENEKPETPTDIVRDRADALFRAAVECCHQHDRISRISAKSTVEEELRAAHEACEACDETLKELADAYEEASANVHPTGPDEGWWKRANALWLASREYARRNNGSDASSKELKEHGPDRLTELQTEYELEASALLGLRHAADAYRRDRPSAT